MCVLFWEVGALTNLRLVVVVALSALLQLGIQHISIAARFFQIGPLELRESAISILLGLTSVTVIELTKVARRLGRPA